MTRIEETKMTSNDDDHSPGLLILGNRIAMRPIWFDKATERGARIYLARAEATWERSLCEEVIDVTPHNFENLDFIVDAIIALAKRRRIDGIFCPVDFCVPVAAHAAARLGLPGPALSTVKAIRDKHAMREHFARARLPSARSILARHAAEAREAARHIGYPVVIKPTVGAGSVGVTKVEKPAELGEAVELAMGACAKLGAAPEFLVEEYLDGPVLSVEAVMFEGETIYENILYVPEPMRGPHFAVREIVTPPPFAPDAVAELYAINRAVNEAMEFTDGVSHTEYRMTSTGPRLLEVNPRPPGQQSDRLYSAAHGIDFIGAALDCALGIRPRLEPRANGFASYRCLEPSRPGILRAVTGVEGARAIPNIVDVVIAAKPGQRAGSLPPHDIQIPAGYVFALAKSYDDVREATLRAQELIEFELDEPQGPSLPAAAA